MSDTKIVVLLTKVRDVTILMLKPVFVNSFPIAVLQNGTNSVFRLLMIYLVTIAKRIYHVAKLMKQVIARIN